VVCDGAQNFESGLWRANSKDDYSEAAGVEKGDSVLKPKGISKEDLERRAREFGGAP